MKTNVHLRYCVTETYLEWEMLEWTIIQKNKTYILCQKSFFFLIHAVNEKLWKYFVEPERAQTTICRMRMASQDT
jgi:hypothetical protein